MQNYQYKLLTDISMTGFGVKYETHLSAYTPPHWHSAMELLLLVQGNVTCKFENSVILARAGEVYLINPLEVHETRCSRDAVYLCVHIIPGSMCHYEPDFDMLQFSLAYGAYDAEKASAYGKLQEHMLQILSLIRDSGDGNQLEIQSRLFAIAAILARCFSRRILPEEKNLRRSDMMRLEPILEYAQIHHGEDITLDSAADAMGLNKEYFCRLFKKNMGVSYLQYLYQIRTAAVCRELELSDDPIGEIAQRHGFRDNKMLNQYFREIYGCTPSEKRKYFRECDRENNEGQ